MYKTFLNSFQNRRKFIKYILLLIFSACKQTSTNNGKQSNSDNNIIHLGKVSDLKDSYTAFTLYRVAILKKTLSEGLAEIRALSLVCTHQNCIVKKKDESLSHICPCHHSEFDEKGVPLKGPAVKPLAWRKLEKKADNLFLIVDEEVGADWKLLIHES
jgi:Rieske Fe-S protein